MENKTIINETTEKINNLVNELVHNPELSLADKSRFVRMLQCKLNLHIDNMIISNVSDVIEKGVIDFTNLILKEKTNTNQKIKGN